MDFNGNAAIITKYGAFTLAYCQFLEQLGGFKRVAAPETGLTLEQVQASVDDVVGKLLCKGQPLSLQDAAQRLSTGLRYERDLMADRLPALAPLYDALRDAIQSAAPTWDYRRDVERWQRLGRDLARRFYAASPHAATQARLDDEAGLRFEWTREAQQAPFGYREDRLRVAETPVAGTITIRFSFSENNADRFVNYLAYPFYFMHEYVSHVYTTSTQSDIFTDGWLLFAAQRFLRRFYAHSDKPSLHPEQIDVIDIVLPESGVARKGYALARRFQPWADDIASGCFDQLTYHLAASPVSDGFSRTRFLWILERELDEARSRLGKRLEAENCHPESLL